MSSRRRLGVAIVAGVIAGALYTFWPHEPRTIPRTDGPELRFRFTGDDADGEFGHAVAGCGDIDGDGHDDFAITSPYGDTGGKKDVGYVRVLSGKTGDLLHLIAGEESGWYLGIAVACTPKWILVGLEGNGITGHGPGGGARLFAARSKEVLHTFGGTQDMDRYGVGVAIVGSHLLIGAPGTYKENAAGYVEVRDAESGRLVRTLRGENRKGDRFGTVVTGAGDIDEDGMDDIAVGEPLGRQTAGTIWIFSGKNGDVLRQHHGDHLDDRFGRAVALAGDVDGDGRPDLIGGSFAPKGIGYVRVFSAADGKVLLELRAERKGDAFGHAASFAGDVNGDGTPDVVVGAPNATVRGIPNVGFVRVFSGKGGTLLFHYEGTREDGHFGYVVGAADVNGDRLDDLIVGSTIFDAPGEARVISACIAATSTVCF